MQEMLPAKAKDKKKIAQESIWEDWRNWGIKMGNTLKIYVNQSSLKHK